MREEGVCKDASYLKTLLLLSRASLCSRTRRVGPGRPAPSRAPTPTPAGTTPGSTSTIRLTQWNEMRQIHVISYQDSECRKNVRRTIRGTMLLEV